MSTPKKPGVAPAIQYPCTFLPAPLPTLSLPRTRQTLREIAGRSRLLKTPRPCANARKHLASGPREPAPSRVVDNSATTELYLLFGEFRCNVRPNHKTNFSPSRFPSREHSRRPRDSGTASLIRSTGRANSQSIHRRSHRCGSERIVSARLTPRRQPTPEVVNHPGVPRTRPSQRDPQNLLPKPVHTVHRGPLRLQSFPQHPFEHRTLQSRIVGAPVVVRASSLQPFSSFWPSSLQSPSFSQSYSSSSS